MSEPNPQQQQTSPHAGQSRLSTDADSLEFYKTLNTTRDFDGLSNPDRFHPLPEDWLVGCCDIVDSTGLIAAGRFKTVNMVGAASIAALRNQFAEFSFPFIFGGDGASFALHHSQGDAARKVLMDLQAWVAAEFDITLRASLVPVSDIRAAGHDVRVARFGASQHLDYAMFDGGGLSWLETQMKSGATGLAPSAAPHPPDLTGLSCRWDNMAAQNGVILSVLVKPASGAVRAEFDKVTRDILEMASELARGGHPVPIKGPGLRFPPRGLWMEAQLGRGRMPAFLRKTSLFFGSIFAGLIFLRGRKLGNFDPTQYRAEISNNADFRKFEDGLKMTLDCSGEVRDQIESRLKAARAAGIADYGLHAQSEAMITCIVPSVTRADHIHFVDGAEGGYAQAAQMLKRG